MRKLLLFFGSSLLLCGFYPRDMSDRPHVPRPAAVVSVAGALTFSSSSVMSGINDTFNQTHNTSANSNRVGVVLVAFTNAGGPAGATWNGVEMTTAARSIQDQGYVGSVIYTIVNPPSGNATVSYRATNPVQHAVVFAVDYYGADQTTGFTIPTSSASDSSSIATSLSCSPTSQNSDIIIDVVGLLGIQVGLTPNANQFQIIASATASTDLEVGVSTKAGATGPTAMGWSWVGGARTEMSALSIKHN